LVKQPIFKNEFGNIFLLIVCCDYETGLRKPDWIIKNNCAILQHVRSSILQQFQGNLDEYFEA